MENLKHFSDLIKTTDYEALIEAFEEVAMYTYTIGSIDSFKDQTFGFEAMTNFTQHDNLNRKLLSPVQEEEYFYNRYLFGTVEDNIVN